jgi:hypothetical protein
VSSICSKMPQEKGQSVGSLSECPQDNPGGGAYSLAGVLAVLQPLNWPQHLIICFYKK